MKKTKSESPSVEKGSSTVRERTLIHMDDLMRAATTVGAGIVLACGAKAQSQKPPVVCDPLPPPVGCCENPDQLLLRGCLNQKAQWVKLEGKWTISLTLEVNPGPTRVSFEGLKREAIKADSVSIKDLKPEPRKLAVVLVPAATARKAGLQFPVLCNNRRITVKLSVDISKSAKEGASVPVSFEK